MSPSHSSVRREHIRKIHPVPQEGETPLLAVGKAISEARTAEQRGFQVMTAHLQGSAGFWKVLPPQVAGSKGPTHLRAAPADTWAPWAALRVTGTQLPTSPAVRPPGHHEATSRHVCTAAELSSPLRLGLNEGSAAGRTGMGGSRLKAQDGPVFPAPVRPRCV